MFMRYYVELDLPFHLVERTLQEAPTAWILGAADDAHARGERLLSDVGFGPPGYRVGKKVEIQLGRVTQFPSKTILPMSWRPVGAEALFPSLDADIEVAALGVSRTQLSISARYRPPLGILGRVVDRALLHRVAEATIKDFLDRVGASIRLKVLAPA